MGDGYVRSGKEEEGGRAKAGYGGEGSVLEPRHVFVLDTAKVVGV